MNKFRIASRFDGRYKFEKCPQCKTGFQDFMELSDDLLACFACGVAFVPKNLKDSEWAGKKAQLEKQLLEIKDIEPEDGRGMKCTMLDEDGKICGQICKNKLGLMAHQRKHGANSKP